MAASFSRRGTDRVFARLRGSAKLGLTTDELMALTRGEDEG